MARLWVMATVALLAVGGCANVKPFHPVQNREDPDGPGLFSGKGGKIILYDSATGEDIQE